MQLINLNLTFTSACSWAPTIQTLDLGAQLAAQVKLKAVDLKRMNQMCSSHEDIQTKQKANKS